MFTARMSGYEHQFHRSSNDLTLKKTKRKIDEFEMLFCLNE